MGVNMARKIIIRKLLMKTIQYVSYVTVYTLYINIGNKNEYLFERKH